MGAHCCVAARDKTLPDDLRFEVSNYRNIRYSPSWSFRWDTRTHNEDIMDNQARFSHHGGGDTLSEIKSATDTDSEGLSNEGSPRGAFEKSLVKKGVTSNSKDGMAEGDRHIQEKETIKHGGSASASNATPSILVTSNPSSSTSKLDPSSFRTHSLLPDPTSSRQAHRSPGFQLSRQVSDSRIPSLKSLNENSSPEGRRSFVPSTGGSQNASSDGWSILTITDLMASSQRERWSFDSGSIKGKLAVSSTQPSPCRICSKLLKERSSWSTNELSVAAVLVCGHVYHAECLESMTAETDRFDPPCPICTSVEKPASKLKGRSKISRIAIADADGDSDSIPAFQKGGKGPRMGTSSSMKSSFGRPLPFLRRHFSIGSCPSQSASESENTRKKGFWARYRRD